jgi:hypothetical protein
MTTTNNIIQSLNGLASNPETAYDLAFALLESSGKMFSKIVAVYNTSRIQIRLDVIRKDVSHKCKYNQCLTN